MTVLQALILGVVQGVTEFLPISSSGHLIIIPEIFGWRVQPLVFDTTLHLGTALALIVYFYKDILEILIKKIKFGWIILAGSIPAGLIGFFFGDFFENTFRNTTYVVLFLFAGSLLMFIAELFVKRVKIDEKVGIRKSVLIGLFQSLALLPGMSRSGSTISGGMLLGLSRRKAARFSFLLSIPIVLGAAVFKIVESFSAVQEVSILTLSVGFVSSLVVGLLAIKFLLTYLGKKDLWVFIVYRLVLITALLTFLYM